MTVPQQRIEVTDEFKSCTRSSVETCFFLLMSVSFLLRVTAFDTIFILSFLLIVDFEIQFNIKLFVSYLVSFYAFLCRVLTHKHKHTHTHTHKHTPTELLMLRRKFESRFLFIALFSLGTRFYSERETMNI